jgi:hypothetical protein
MAKRQPSEPKDHWQIMATLRDGRQVAELVWAYTELQARLWFRERLFERGLPLKQIDHVLKLS